VSHIDSTQFESNTTPVKCKKRFAYYLALLFFASSCLSYQIQAQALKTQESVAQDTDNDPQDDRLIDIPAKLVNKPEPADFNNSLAGVYGSISSVGSDTLATLISLWSERFKSVYPHVKFQIQAFGSATAPQALTQGTATIGPMSRALTTGEISRFTQKYGYPPTTLIVAVDAIAIYVEKNNPLQALSLQQVDALFSATRFCGSKKKLGKWTDLGVSKFGEARDVLLYGRNSASGTYDLFKQQALCSGDFKARVNELPSSSSIVLSIASSVGGMGYAALGYSDENVKALQIGVNISSSAVSPMSRVNNDELTNKSSNSIANLTGSEHAPMFKQEQIEYIEPNSENITLGKYPFSRYLYIIVNKPPNKALPILERAFLRFILSEEGQDMVRENGYYSVNKQLRDKQLDTILR
jgi:phosphate transport system substrate-binding protein